MFMVTTFPRCQKQEEGYKANYSQIKKVTEEEVFSQTKGVYLLLYNVTFDGTNQSKTEKNSDTSSDDDRLDSSRKLVTKSNHKKLISQFEK